MELKGIEMKDELKLLGCKTWVWDEGEGMGVCGK